MGLSPHQIIRRGIGHVPEGRKLFPKMSVLENLKMGAYLRNNKAEIEETLAMVYEGGPAQLNTAGDGTVTPPFGLFGAQPGLPHIYKIISNGKERVLHSKETGVSVHPGDRIEVLSAGGGGFGDPAERPAEQRAQDRQNGYCSG